MSTTFYPLGIDDPENRYSLNISNGYAHVPLEMMGLKDMSSVQGKLRVEQLRAALDRAKVAPLEPHVCSDLIDENTTFCGRNRVAILYYRSQICAILEICIKWRVALVWS